MSTAAKAREILDTMFGYLGFVVEIETGEEGGTPSLQVTGEAAKALIGPGGEGVDDIQYLLNRLVQARDPEAPRVRVDVEHFRAIQEDELIGRTRELAETVRSTGCPVKTEPMNSYFRRLIHQAFADDPEIRTWSPPDKALLKRITLMPRAGGNQG